MIGTLWSKKGRDGGSRFVVVAEATTGVERLPVVVLHGVSSGRSVVIAAAELVAGYALVDEGPFLERELNVDPREVIKMAGDAIVWRRAAVVASALLLVVVSALFIGHWPADMMSAAVSGVAR